MRFAKTSGPLKSVALLILSIGTVGAAQEAESPTRAPMVSVYSRDGAVFSNYVTPAIEVGEDAYVFAVSTDFNGQIQVLYPEFPGISVRIRARHELQLQNFFAGFAPRPQRGLSSYGYAGYDDYSDGIDGSRGTVIAIASREPFNLDLIESGGDWNITAIRGLIADRSPASAANALARYIGRRGEPIGRDWFRFAGGRTYDYAYNGLSSCELYYGFSYGSPLASLQRAAILNQLLNRERNGRQPKLVGYDACGIPIVSYGPVVTRNLPPTGFHPLPPRDSSRVPKSREPHARVPRGAATGAFPATDPGESGTPTSVPAGKETGIIVIPARDRTESTGLIDELRTQGGGQVPPSRMPTEVRQPTRTESSTGGAQPPREYHPMKVPSASPPPSRTPDPVRVPSASPPPPRSPDPVRVAAPPARSDPRSTPSSAGTVRRDGAGSGTQTKGESVPPPDR